MPDRIIPEKPRTVPKYSVSQRRELREPYSSAKDVLGFLWKAYRRKIKNQFYAQDVVEKEFAKWVLQQLRFYTLHKQWLDWKRSPAKSVLLGYHNPDLVDDLFALDNLYLTTREQRQSGTYKPRKVRYNAVPTLVAPLPFKPEPKPKDTRTKARIEWEENPPESQKEFMQTLRDRIREARPTNGDPTK